VGIARDVTERRRLEREAAERAAQLEAIFESIADGICVTDRQGRVQHMNQAYRTLLGLELDPMGWTFLQLEEVAGFVGYTPAGEPLIEVENPIRRVLRGEILTNEQSVDIILRMRAGREVRLNLSGAPIPDATGQLLGSVLVARDVTEQRRLEQQTRETLKALLAMAEALVQVPDQGSAVGVEAALERHPAARHLAELTRRVLGCEQVSIVAVESGTEAMRPITLVGLTPEQEQQWWSDLEACPRMPERLHPDVVAALETGEPVLIERLQPPLSLWQRLTPGRASLLVPMRIGETLVGLLRVDGGVQGEADTGTNRQALLRAVARLGALMLERERLLREREEARASELALRETQAQMDTFLGMAGHELKNPLTSLKLALQLIERRIIRMAQDESDRSHPLAPLLDQVELAGLQTSRLERLVNELLDASRVRAGMLEFHLEPTDLAVIVGEAVDEQRQAHPEHTLTVQLAPLRAVPVVADADRIGQVVTNYLTNALKYSPANRPVAVGLDVEEGQARVWVRDQGPGLPPEEQERIWERFHRVKGIEVQSGTGVGLGLGLHICRTIIERHQGQVGVESAPGQGSTFWFTLKLAGESEEGGPAPG
jgi:signal transduction histidine kinase